MSGVLVTGATTPTGRELVRALSALRHGPHVLAVGADQSRLALDGLDPSRVSYQRVDLTRPRAAHDLIFGPVRELGVDAIVHAPLHRSVSHAGAHTHAQIVESTRELISLAERQPTIRRFVFRSSSSVYKVDPSRATLITEDDPLELGADAPDIVRDRVEADLVVSARAGLSRLGIVVLRCAEILAPAAGSQLYDYLASRVCLRPLGFDPMLNVLSLADVTHATLLALGSDANGVVNVPGADTLPLSRAIELWNRIGIPLPGPLLAPLYRVRASALGMEFRYDLNYRAFHFSTVLDGSLAKRLLGYEPRHPIAWPGEVGRGALDRFEGEASCR